MIEKLEKWCLSGFRWQCDMTPQASCRPGKNKVGIEMTPKASKAWHFYDLLESKTVERIGNVVKKLEK